MTGARAAQLALGAQETYLRRKKLKRLAEIVRKTEDWRVATIAIPGCWGHHGTLSMLLERTVLHLTIVTVYNGGVMLGSYWTWAAWPREKVNEVNKNASALYRKVTQDAEEILREHE